MNSEAVILVPPEGDFCVLEEAIVGAFGLPDGKPFVGIKGDPSLRETAPIRSKFESRIDRKVGPALERIEWLLSETGCYAAYVGFNSSEVRTESIFSPFNYEIHDVDNLLLDDYLRRHFVNVPYEEKINTIAWVSSMIQTGPLRNYLPVHWRKLMDAQRESWHPVKKEQIHGIIRGLDQLRAIDGYYLRNAAISLSEGIVRASFNCDGTYIVRADSFPEFVKQNLPG
jgi:hypothetical protein